MNTVAGHSPRIAFCILSSRPEAGQAIDSMVALLAPHPVWVHHDEGRGGPLRISHERLGLIDRPEATQWGDWSLVRAMLRLLEAALSDPGVSHVQFLSESCLPLQPLTVFEAYLQRELPDVMMDFLPLHTPEAFLSHGWRYLFARPGWRDWHYRMAWMACGAGPDWQPKASLQLQGPGGAPLRGKARLAQAGAGAAIGLLRGLQRAAVALAPGWPSAIGGQFFGLSRAAAQRLLVQAARRPALARRLMRRPIPDECYFHSLILDLLGRESHWRLRPANHALIWAPAASGPRPLRPEDLPVLMRSGRFFARKFALSAADPARLLCARQLAMAQPGPAALSS